MFFAKALGGSLVVVFGGFWAAGAFSPEQEVLRAVETVRKAEIEDNKTAAWGPHCDKLRDKVFGMSGGMPVAMTARDGVAAIAKVHNAARELEAAGCDPDAAPGAFSPFEPGKNEFRKVTTTMGDAPSGQGQHDPAPYDPGRTEDLHSDGGWGIPAQK